jgi:RNA polymerase sigma-70 factor (ECF subfamily)
MQEIPQPEHSGPEGDSHIFTAQKMGQSPDAEHSAILENWPSAADLIEAQRILSRRAVELVRAEFEQHTWEAWWKVAVEGRLPADVAAEMGMSLAAVYKAKSRVLLRLRQELDGLQD